MQQADLGLTLSTKRTRKREFLAQMERIVPWAELEALIEPYAPKSKTGRPSFALQTMLRTHFMQQWFTLSDPAMEESLHDVPLFREFAQLSRDERLPDESTILRFRHLLERHKLAQQMQAPVNQALKGKSLMLKAGTVVDAALIAALSSTKNSSSERDPSIRSPASLSFRTCRSSTSSSSTAQERSLHTPALSPSSRDADALPPQEFP